MYKAKNTLRTPPSIADAGRIQSGGTSGRINVSTGGYAEYKPPQQEDSTYQELRDDLSERPENNTSEQIYANESVMHKGKINKKW